MYEELVKALRNCGDTTIDGCVGCAYQEPQMLCNQHLMTKAADAIEELSKPKWIPVTERLPEEDEEVLVVAVNDFNEDDRWAAVDWLYCGEWKQHSIVTHWMSLPTPPKEEET